MKKRLLSILLTACMVFPAGPPAAYAANATDQAERSAISEDGEGQQPDGDIQEGSGTGTTNDASLKNHSGTLTTQADLDEDLAGDGYITEVMAADKDDFLNQYRSLLAQRVAKFRVTVPLEAKMRTIDDCVPSSVVFNDEDFNSWENSQCFIDYPVTISYEGYEDEDDGLLVYLRNIVSYHIAEGHSNQQSIILTFPDKIPDGVDIEIDGMPAELNDDRTKAKTIGNYPTQTYKAEDVKIRVKFIGLHKSDIADENRILFRSWLLSSQDVYAHNSRVPFEGDYLRHHLDGTPDIYVWDPVITGIDEASHTYYYDLSVDCTATYYSTGEMEDEVAAEINRVLGELDLDSKSEYEKIKAIHDYICDNTVYQYPQDGDDPPMVKHSAYSALISKKAVCDGYANLFYRMCLQAGIDARIVFGQGRSEEHAWNIVKLGSLYYDVDCTWDVNSYDYYFLLGHSEFLEDHTPKPEFTNQEFLDAYPMSETTYSPPKFKTASLILGGKIGLNMMIELPDIPEFDYDSSYVEFTVNGGEPIRQDYDPNRTNRDGTLFKFTCYVNSVQMADDITAVFHYLENGEEKKVSQTYTIEQYLRSLSILGQTAEEKALANATADYGYYVQPYLADANGWSLEGENAAHTRMSFRDAAGYLNKIEEILNGIGSGPSADKASDVSSLGISLRLDTDTALNVFIYTDAEYTGTLSATVDDEAVEAIKVEEGKYQIVIPNIGAKDLNKKYKTVVTTDAGESTVEVSALDYAKIVLSNPNATYNEKQAMGAIYHYYVAAVAYANSLANANA